MYNNTLYAQASHDGGMIWNTVWSWGSAYGNSSPWSLAQVDLSSADFEPPYWQIDTAELNRVLAYWRVGCYHADTNGPDGYAAGCASLGMLGSVAHSAVPVYSPGGLVTVTNSVQYSGSLLSLLWRPALPAGWALQSVSGDGNPELGNGDITWPSASLPPSPIRFGYVVRVASGDTGLK
jgi:hypothetical protein